MHLRTLLNAVYKHKGFVYESESLDSSTNRLTIKVRERLGSRPQCSCCENLGPIYDHQPVRSFQMPPIWGVAVFLMYAMRRVNCSHCQRVCIEKVPWSVGGKSPLTTAFAHQMASFCKMLSCKEVAHRFGVSWDTVAQSVEWMVTWGLKHRSLEGITSIGVDEIQYSKGHKYLTLVYQIDSHAKRLLWIGKERTQESFAEFFTMLGTDRCQKIQFVCSDMWKAYLNMIQLHAPNALNILDRFHIVAKLNQAVDQTRRNEVAKLNSIGKPATLKKSRWVWLKRPENLTDDGRSRLNSLLKANLTTVRAYLLKEEFDHFWSYTSPTWAAKFLDNWCRTVNRRRSLPELHKFVKTIQSHQDLILNYFRAKKGGHGALSSGVVEGFNNKTKLCIRKSYGYRTDKMRENALFLAMGGLPEPEPTHRFA